MKVAEKLDIPFHRALIEDAEVAAVSEVVRSGWLTMGPRTVQFEQEFAAYVGAKHALAVSSCTAALHLCLEAAGIKAGDEVLVPTNTFAATGEVVEYLGARPVLVDIDPVTLNIDVEDAARRVTPRTRAIMPVHFSGQPCDMDEIRSLADKHGLHVIEDAAHSLPASYKGRPVGSISEMTAFSFYATKTLTTGEGGMVTTDDDKLADRVRIMRLHGISRDAWKRYSAEGSWYYEVLAPGYKYNMTDIQSSIGLVQLKKCDRMNEMRRTMVETYNEAFANIPGLQTPVEKSDRRSAWHLYVIRVDEAITGISRDEVINELKRRGIGTSVHFIPLHRHPFYAGKYGYKPEDLPVAHREFGKYLSLPLFPGMSDVEIEHVIGSVIGTVTRQNI
jgi:dTDP-4-amino-4,6-dideoxygalactose transaminase